MLVVLSLLLMLKTFIDTIVGIQRERSHKMITLLELRRNALPEGIISDNPILTEMPMSVLELQQSEITVILSDNKPQVRQSIGTNGDSKDQIEEFSQECLSTMRGFVPPHIFTTSLAFLVDEDGLSEPLAKRMLSKECLWLVRMDPEDIQKLSDADLMDRFNPLDQQLDIVELAAVFACLSPVYKKSGPNDDYDV
eukprot:gene22269-28840_t